MLNQMMKNDKPKGSFVYQDSLLKEKFKQKADADGRNMSDIINELITGYVQNSKYTDVDQSILKSIRKLKLLTLADDVNIVAIQREVKRLWNQVQS